METSIKEIAQVLRSTEQMAAQFADRVQERVGQTVPEEDILAIMKGISPKRLSLGTVVDKLNRKLQTARD